MTNKVTIDQLCYTAMREYMCISILFANKLRMPRGASLWSYHQESGRSYRQLTNVFVIASNGKEKPCAGISQILSHGSAERWSFALISVNSETLDPSAVRARQSIESNPSDCRGSIRHAANHLTVRTWLSALARFIEADPQVFRRTCRGSRQ